MLPALLQNKPFFLCVLWSDFSSETGNLQSNALTNGFFSGPGTSQAPYLKHRKE